MHPITTSSFLLKKFKSLTSLITLFTENSNPCDFVRKNLIEEKFLWKTIEEHAITPQFRLFLKIVLNSRESTRNKEIALHRRNLHD